MDYMELDGLCLKEADKLNQSLTQEWQGWLTWDARNVSQKDVWLTVTLNFELPITLNSNFQGQICYIRQW